MTKRALLLLAALLAVACSGDDAGPPPTTRVIPSSTSVVDFSGVALPGVDGETTTTIDETGTALLIGTVVGPTGPLAGATVRVDRIVAGSEVRHDLLTGPDGRWELRDVPGGRYRVRAFLAPTYAQTSAEVRFLADGSEHTFDLVVSDQRGIVVRTGVAPGQPTIGAALNLVVLVAQRTVDPDGVVRSSPVAAITVELSGLGRWVLRDDSAATTSTTSTTSPGSPATTATSAATTTTTTVATGPNASVRLSDTGRARFELRCRSVGAPGLSLRVPVTDTAEPLVTVETVLLELPECIDPAATTTTTASNPGSSSTAP